MEITVNKIDDANVVISGTIEKTLIDQKIDVLAKKIAKDVVVHGFRPGKVPVSMVKNIHQEKLKQDAQSEAIQELMQKAIEDNGLESEKMLGEPLFKSFEEKEDGTFVELEVSFNPEVNLGNYQELIPTFDKPEVTHEEIDKELETIASEYAEYESISDNRSVENKDMVIIDFDGYIDGKAFEGGKYDNYELKIGSNGFIEGFEEQLIGMHKEESKRIEVTFPKEYQIEELKGKDAEFKVTLKDIKKKKSTEITQDIVLKVLPNAKEEEQTIENLTNVVKERIEKEKLYKLYNEELKPKLSQALVDTIDFAIPKNILEQEIDAKVNQEAKTMTNEQIEELKNSKEKLEEFRDTFKEDAIKSVKATFIVNTLAQKENIFVNDQEVSQRLYYEAMMQGNQNPEELMNYYKENNLLPAVKMEMIENKLFSKLLNIE